MFYILFDFIWMMTMSPLESALNLIYTTLFPLVPKLAFDMPGYISSYGIKFEQLNSVIYAFAIQFIILKFVKKVVDIYGLQVDGDSNLDIVVLLTNFCKALVIALTFTVIWSWIYDIASDMLTQLTAAVDIRTNVHMAVLDGLNNAKAAGEGIGMLCIGALDVGLLEIMTIFQIANGIQLWILRLGMPLACVGLLDADQGVFRTYLKLFLKVILTILVQYTLMNFGSVLLVSSFQADETFAKVMLLIISIGMLVTAFTTPKILSELMMPKQGGGGKVMQVVYLGSILARSL